MTNVKADHYERKVSVLEEQLGDWEQKYEVRGIVSRMNESVYELLPTGVGSEVQVCVPEVIWSEGIKTPHNPGTK